MAKYAMLAMTKKGGFPLLLFGFLVEPFRVDDLLLRHSRNFLSGIQRFLNTVDPGLKIAGVTNKGQYIHSGTG